MLNLLVALSQSDKQVLVTFLLSFVVHARVERLTVLTVLPIPYILMTIFR